MDGAGGVRHPLRPAFRSPGTWVAVVRELAAMPACRQRLSAGLAPPNPVTVRKPARFLRPSQTARETVPSSGATPLHADDQPKPSPRRHASPQLPQEPAPVVTRSTLGAATPGTDRYVPAKPDRTECVPVVNQDRQPVPSVAAARQHSFVFSRTNRVKTIH
jgi:hypothetical protein